MTMIVIERWYGQGNEPGGLHTRVRVDPTCEMIVQGPCGRPATTRANEIDIKPMESRRYPSDMYWCAEHAALVMEVRP